MTGLSWGARRRRSWCSDTNKHTKGHPRSAINVILVPARCMEWSGVEATWSLAWFCHFRSLYTYWPTILLSHNPCLYMIGLSFHSHVHCPWVHSLSSHVHFPQSTWLLVLVGLLFLVLGEIHPMESLGNQICNRFLLWCHVWYPWSNCFVKSKTRSYMQGPR